MTLQAKSYDLRLRVLDMVYRAKTGHIGGDFSVCDILNVLYNKVMDVTPENFSTVDHDHFILSKGHSVEALYSVLCDRGFFPEKDLETFSQFGSKYIGHPNNKVAGIVTTGRIGQCMARICKGYGMTVLAWDAYPNKALEEEGLLTYVSKEELFQRSDLISIHGPLIMGEGGTYHLINDKAISMMKDGVMLVNTARGGFIDTNALLSGLRAGKFHAVALDVYEGQDEVVYTDHSDDILSNDVVARLTSFPQVVVTSHQAFFTREALQAIAADTLENARNFLQGLPYGKAEVVR